MPLDTASRAGAKWLLECVFFAIVFHLGPVNTKSQAMQVLSLPQHMMFARSLIMHNTSV